MSGFVDVAIVGTGQVPASDTENTATPVDALVERVVGVDRERALLLRAGGVTTLDRAARITKLDVRRLDASPPDTSPRPSARLTDIIATLFTDRASALLIEVLERMARAGMRLSEELLPVALAQTAPELRTSLRPVLGERGVWLAGLKPAWSWALSEVHARDTQTSEIAARFDLAPPAERRTLLALAFRSDPGLARTLLTASFKEEKAEHRLTWLDVLGANLTRDDAHFLNAALADRSAPVRTAAARLLWRLPESELAVRVRARADALVSFDASTRTLDVRLPPETFDAAWEREGIVESVPAGVGPRQWWLAQIVSAVPPDHWCARFGVSPSQIVAAVEAHDLASAVLDGLDTAALLHDTKPWFAPLWDAASRSNATMRLTYNPVMALSAKLAPDEAEPRMLALFDDTKSHLLAAFPRPWPDAVSKRFVDALHVYKPSWTHVLPIAAMAIPVAHLPVALAVPEVAADDYAARAFLRALDEFQSVAGVRRAIAEEIAP